MASSETEKKSNVVKPLKRESAVKNMNLFRF